MPYLKLVRVQRDFQVRDMGIRRKVEINVRQTEIKGRSIRDNTVILLRKQSREHA